MGNTVGSLSEVQHQIVVGTLLGDGTMRCKANALLEINHSVTQARYVNWKYLQLIDLVSTPPRSRKGNAGRIAYRFVTRSVPELNEYYRQFFLNGRKQVPMVDLTPLSLAVWFMDDGSKSRDALYLNTQSFTEKDQRLLLRLLKEQHDLVGNLNRDGKYTRIRLNLESSRTLSRIIEPHVLPMFRYKLPQVTP